MKGALAIIMMLRHLLIAAAPHSIKIKHRAYWRLLAAKCHHDKSLNDSPQIPFCDIITACKGYDVSFHRVLRDG